MPFKAREASEMHAEHEITGFRLMYVNTMLLGNFDRFQNF